MLSSAVWPSSWRIASSLSVLEQVSAFPSFLRLDDFDRVDTTCGLSICQWTRGLLPQFSYKDAAAMNTDAENLFKALLSSPAVGTWR